jgi:hypothetical protein
LGKQPPEKQTGKQHEGNEVKGEFESLFHLRENLFFLQASSIYAASAWMKEGVSALASH